MQTLLSIDSNGRASLPSETSAADARKLDVARCYIAAASAAPPMDAGPGQGPDRGLSTVEFVRLLVFSIRCAAPFSSIFLHFL